MAEIKTKPTSKSVEECLCGDIKQHAAAFEKLGRHKTGVDARNIRNIIPMPH